MLTTRLLLRSSFGLLLNLYITTLLIKDCERLNVKSTLIYKQFVGTVTTFRYRFHNCKIFARLNHSQSIFNSVNRTDIEFVSDFTHLEGVTTIGQTTVIRRYFFV